MTRDDAKTILAALACIAPWFGVLLAVRLITEITR